MAKVTSSVPAKYAAWINSQPMFFVASAPLGAEGHVNVSPKGLPDTFVLLDEHRFVYLDLSGSGAETIAHVRENGRLTVMFCAFSGPPRILRMYGRAAHHPVGTAGFDELHRQSGLPAYRGMRAMIELTVDRVSTSCGFGVPEMELKREREHLPQWANTRTMEQILEYRVRENTFSIDGLAAIDHDPTEPPTDPGSDGPARS